jgi:hypothetical protein
MKWKILLGMAGAAAVASVFIVSGRDQLPDKPPVPSAASEAAPPEARVAASNPLEKIQRGEAKTAPQAVGPSGPAPTMAPSVADREPEHAFPDPATEEAERGADPRLVEQRDAEEEKLRQIRNQTPVIRNN